MNLLDGAAAGPAMRRDRGNIELRRREAPRRPGVDLARLPQAVHASGAVRRWCRAREAVGCGARLLRCRPRGRWHETAPRAATGAARIDRARLKASPGEREARPATERGRVPESEGGPREGRCAARDPLHSGRWRGPGASRHQTPPLGRAAPDGPGQKPGDAAMLEGIELEQAARGGSPRLWKHWPCEWGELLYDLGAHDSDDGIIGHSDGLAVVREMLLGRDANVEDRRQLGEHSPILRRVLDAQGGHRFPAFFLPVLHHLYELTLLARGNTGYGDGMLEGWVVAALRPLGRAVALQHLSRERGPLTEAEATSLAEARTSARDLLPGVEGSQPSVGQWEAINELERGVLRVRLGRDEEGDRMHPLPAGHTLRAEQDALGHYGLPGWEQRRGLPQYTSYGRSRTSEEFKCATGQTVGDWDAAKRLGARQGREQVGEEEQAPASEPGRVRLLLSARGHLGVPLLPPGGEPPGCVCRVVHAQGLGGSPKVRRVR
jgi:hypothetical protein